MGWPTIVTAKEKNITAKGITSRKNTRVYPDFFCAVEMINKYDFYW